MLEGLHFGCLSISSLLFADDVLLLFSSGGTLQLALECEVVGTTVSTSNSKAMVLSQKRVKHPMSYYPGGEVPVFQSPVQQVREEWSMRLTDELG